jgi:hypothetical protein
MCPASRVKSAVALTGIKLECRKRGIIGGTRALVLPSDTSWLFEPTTGVHQFGGGSEPTFRRSAKTVTGASLIVMKLIGGYGICSSRTSPRGLKPKRHRCQRAGRVRWCLKGNSMDIITREQAITLGLKKYFDGLPCKHGHISERYVSSGCCAKCTGDGAKGRYRDNADCQEARKRRLPHP